MSVLRRYWRRATALAVLLTVLGGSLVAAFRRDDDAALLLWGAGDLVPLGQAIQAAAPNGHALRFVSGPPGRRLLGLRNGEADAVLLGRAPTPAELSGLAATAIALDAIVFLVDENSWQGGIVTPEQPAARGDGLRDLRLSDVKGLLTYYSAPAERRWAWPGKYYRWETCLDTLGRTVKAPRGRYAKCWQRQTPTVMIRQMIEPGVFDTQTALHQLTGLDEAVEARSWPERTHVDLGREEEVVAAEYANSAVYTAGAGDFQFRLTYASRPVARLALRHVPARVVTIEGVDPLADAAVLPRRYPLRRGIHLLFRAEDDRARKLAAWLRSPDGQRLVAGVGFEPWIGEAR